MENEVFFLANEKLAYKLGHTMWRKYQNLHEIMDLEDFISEVMLCFIKIISEGKYDFSRGSFSTYAYTVVDHYFCDLLRKNKNTCLTFTDLASELFSSSQTESHDTTVEEFFGQEDMMLELIELLEAVACFLRTCTEKERAIWKMRLSGCSQAECATLLVEKHVMERCSQPMVNSLLKSMKKRFVKEVLFWLEGIEVSSQNV